MSEKKKSTGTTSKRRGLGRGLGALIQTESLPEEENTGGQDQSGIQEIELRMIEPDKNQPRKTFDEEALEELAASLKEYGMLQPLIVQKSGDDRYQIIAGERRWRAAKRAGLEKVPVLIKEFAPQEVLEISLIENIQRENLNPVEEAKAYQRLIKEFSLKQEDVAVRVGKSRTSITNSMRLLQLDDEVLSYLASGQLSTGHGKVLLGVKDKEKQKEYAKRVIENDLSVRALEELIQAKPRQIPVPELLSPDEEAVYKEITRKLQTRLGTKVSIIRGPKKNHIEIEYYSEEELERLIEILG